jgi:hypothetical protein
MHALQAKIRTSANWSYDEARKGVGYLGARSNILATRCRTSALREPRTAQTELTVGAISVRGRYHLQESTTRFAARVLVERPAVTNLAILATPAGNKKRSVNAIDRSIEVDQWFFRGS